MTTHNPSDFSVPIMVKGRHPLTPSDIAAARMTRSALRKALSMIDDQISCLGAHQFFIDNPKIDSVDLHGSWESNDEGGSYFSWMATAKNAQAEMLAEGFEPTDDEYDASDFGSEQCSDLFDCLEGVEDHFQELTMSSANAMERIGKARMGDQAYAAWRAQAEKSSIDSATCASISVGDGALRV